MVGVVRMLRHHAAQAPQHLGYGLMELVLACIPALHLGKDRHELLVNGNRVSSFHSFAHCWRESPAELALEGTSMRPYPLGLPTR